MNFYDNNQDQFWSSNVVLEQRPIGCDLLYDTFGRVSSCYATSYNWGHYHHDDIRLLKKGEEQVSSKGEKRYYLIIGLILVFNMYNKIYCNSILVDYNQSSN